MHVVNDNSLSYKAHADLTRSNSSGSQRSDFDLEMDQMLNQEGEEGTIANCMLLYMISFLFSYLNTIQTFLGIRSVLRAYEIKNKQIQK